MHFVKTFQDSYSMSRESYFLDLLRQYGAEVPSILSSDVYNKKIEMLHGGLDLTRWIEQTRVGCEPHGALLPVLALAAECIVDVSDKGVWHLDLAMRNILVHEDAGRISVRLIDFSLAVSDSLPLQKPLWIYASSHLHHPLLVQAINADWDSFFSESGLKKPEDFSRSFDVPIDVYEKTWLKELRVDAIPQRWCLVAHGTACLLNEVAVTLDRSSSVRSRLLELAQKLKCLMDDAEALAALRSLPARLSSLDLNGTPRPVGVRFAHTHPEGFDPATRTVSDSGALDPDVNADSTHSGTDAPSWGGRGKSLFLLMLAVGAQLGIYFFFDVMFLAYQVKLSGLSLALILIAAVLSVIALGFLGRRGQLRQAIGGVCLLQTTAMLGLLMDVWSGVAPRVILIFLSFLLAGNLLFSYFLLKGRG